MDWNIDNYYIFENKFMSLNFLSFLVVMLYLIEEMKIINVSIN